MTVLDVAEVIGNEEIINYIELAANPNKVIDAAKDRDWDSVKLYIKRGFNVNNVDEVCSISMFLMYILYSN